MKIKLNLIGFDALAPALEAAAFAGENVLLVAKHGTSKSLLARQFFSNFEGKLFATQVTKWSDETQLFGLPDLEKLKRGKVHYNGEGTLLDAEWAFLDELFDGSDPLLRTTLGPLHERQFSRGGVWVKMPLRMAIATSNYTRVNAVTEAVLDRFLVQLPPPRLNVPQLVTLLDNSRDFETYEAPERLSPVELDAVAKSSTKVRLTQEQMRAIAEIGVGLDYSPRRLRKIAQLARVAAAMEGRTEAWPEDCLLAMASSIPVQHHERRDTEVKKMADRFGRMGAEQRQSAELESILKTKLPKGLKEKSKVLTQLLERLAKVTPANDELRAKFEEVRLKMDVLAKATNEQIVALNAETVADAGLNLKDQA